MIIRELGSQKISTNNRTKIYLHPLALDLDGYWWREGRFSYQNVNLPNLAAFAFYGTSMHLSKRLVSFALYSRR